MVCFVVFGGFGGPGGGFGGPGGGLNGRRSSGKPLLLLRFKKPPPGPPKPTKTKRKTKQHCLGRLPLSDLDETWWKLFPGVSRSFLNSSETKMTAKNIGRR